MDVVDRMIYLTNKYKSGKSQAAEQQGKEIEKMSKKELTTLIKVKTLIALVILFIVMIAGYALILFVRDQADINSISWLYDFCFMWMVIHVVAHVVVGVLAIGTWAGLSIDMM